LLSIKDNPAFKTPIAELKEYFASGIGRLEFDTHLCFVCGANGPLASDGNPSLRFQFLRFLGEKKPRNFVPLKAEIALEEFVRDPDEHHVNLSDFETAIGETVNSILIFPESPGSFAEVGLFSGSEELAEKTLVACREAYQGSSFLTMGPIHYLSSASQYRPIPIVVGNNEDAAFDQISERLLEYSLDLNPPPRRHRKRLTSCQLKLVPPRTQVAIISELICICGFLTEEDFKFLIAEIFGKYDISRVRHQLALLVAMNRVCRSEVSDIIARQTTQLLIEFPSDIRNRLQAKWRNAYRREAPQLLQEAQEAINESS